MVSFGHRFDHSGSMKNGESLDCSITLACQEVVCSRSVRVYELVG
jgi:hypothetical protein